MVVAAGSGALGTQAVASSDGLSTALAGTIPQLACLIVLARLAAALVAARLLDDESDVQNSAAQVT